jgi:hypothetical protein
MKTSALLENLPDFGIDVLRVLLCPELQLAGRDIAAADCRRARTGNGEIRIGKSAGTDKAERITLPVDVLSVRVVFVDDRQTKRIRF